MLHIIEDSVLDSARLIPFLFVTYLAMEYLEHRTGERLHKLVEGAGRVGPVAGGLLGMVPQCGFSAAAANLYAGRVITLGTLAAIFLSTSDEMLPVLLSERASVGIILKILLAKAVYGMTAGLAIDFVLRKKKAVIPGEIHDICQQERCHCEKGILRSALSHTVQIAFFILTVSIALNLLLHFVGEEALAGLILNRPIAGPMLSGLVGLIPNCAGSVVITQLYLEGAMGLGAAMAGLLAGSGVGLLVLFRVNHNRRENLKILALLYCLGAAGGDVSGKGGFLMVTRGIMDEI